MAKGTDDCVLDSSLQFLPSIHEAWAPPRGERHPGASSEARWEEKRSFHGTPLSPQVGAEQGGGGALLPSPVAKRFIHSSESPGRAVYSGLFFVFNTGA